MKVGVDPLLTALALLSLAGCSSTNAAQATGGGGAGGAGAGVTAGGATTAGTTAAGSTSAGATTAGSASGGSATGGMVMGPANTRCEGRTPYKVNPNGCFLQVEPPEFSNGGSSGAASPSAGTGGMSDCNFDHDAGYGDPLFNDSGDDDDCKYHVTWSSTPIQKNQPFTLTVTATNLLSGEPLGNLPDQTPGTVALSRMEPYVPCDAVHLPPTSTLEAPATETGPGTFSLGPVVLDESARWAMRFHFYGDCFNNSATPHAHIAFFVDVP